ncbi:branched-chain amino acid ABC transporter ATP-binding protein/permease [Tissierella sp.]|uniref:branched-chain amino acid ABC transporter ATP-binding protein/permease n=1 Tax=Tissierella sp. TaxID=41274 RepID=UPI0028638452|nr:branched-chain amino acid ABC transporter ATP-binding protein/permease [Tissierella sp.]MDR7855332.1 branched-chain amino acid ABC transporter ATP-binding protein/permease [Tissierella sp.]
MQESSIAAKSKQKKYSAVLYVLWTAFVVFSLLAPAFIGRYYVGYILVIFVYCILAIGFNIASGFCGITTFSTGAIYAAGAYTSAIMYTSLGLPFIVSALIGSLVAGIVSFVISLSAYKVNGIYLSLVSFGVIEVVLQILSQSNFTGGSQGFRVAKWVFFGTPVSLNAKYYVTFAMVVIVFIIQKNLRKSLWGRDFLAMKDDEIAASGVGINFRKTRVIGFFISSAISGFAGVFYATYMGYISPDSFGFGLSIMILLMVITGGSGTLSGPIVGAVLITVVPELFNANPEMKVIFYGAMLIIITQVMPKGIVGIIKERFKEIENNRYIDKIDPYAEIDFSKYAVKSEREDEDVLVVKGLTKQYGGLTAVNNLDLTVKRGTIHALIGPNGAGKSTCINNMTGIEEPTSGEVWFNGENVTGMESYNLVEKGMTRTYQHVRLFNSMSVIDNVTTGSRFDKHYGLFHALFQTGKKHRLDREAYADAQECLQLLGIEDKANESPDSMSAGQQKLMEIGRALVAKPDLLLLDEPCAGLTEVETEQFAEMIKKIRNTGISILLIEHHMNLVMEVSDWITVIDHGVKIAEGTPEKVSKEPVVRTAYLGE